MKFELSPNNRNTTDEELLYDVNKVAKELNKDSVTMDEYNERGRCHSSTLTRRFGGWFNVLSLAGLKKSRSLINIPDEVLFKNLEEVWAKLGKQPSYTDMQRPLSEFSAGTYENRYGSWRKALEKFVDFINDEGQFSPTNSLKNDADKISSRHKTKRSINWRLRFLVMRRDNFKCKICGTSPAANPKIVLHVDHIKAWANGGETVIENLQTLCSTCNIGKSDL